MCSLSKPWHAAVATLGVTVLASCASTDYHFSQLYGQRHNRAPIDTYDVTIVRVDGKDTPLRPVLVDPGVRKVVVQGPPSGGFAAGRATRDRARRPSLHPLLPGRGEAE